MHAEDVDLSALADAVGTPFYCYSTRDARRAIIEVFKARARRSCRAGLLCGEGQFQPGGADDAGPPRRRHGCRLRGRIAPRAGRRRAPANASHFPASARRAAEMAFALEAGIFCFNVESEPELQRSPEVARRGPRGAGRAARQSRCRREDPREDLHRQGREQIRHSDLAARARSSPSRARCPASRSTGVDMHIGSQITDLAPFDDAFALARRFRRRCAPMGMRSTISTSAAASASPIARSEDPDSYHPDRYAKIVARALSALSAAQVWSSSRAGSSSAMPACS